MTKLPKVIFRQRRISLWLTFFIVSILYLFSVLKIAYAQDAQNLINPSITFGDLLNNQYSPQNTQEEEILAKKQRIKELLDRLEAFYNTPSNTQPFDSIQGKLTTYNLQPSPSPYIPLPTLVARVNEIVNNQNEILGIQQSAVSSQNSVTSNYPANSENRLLNTDNRLLTTPTLQHPTYNSQPITDIGNLNNNPIKTTYVVALLGDSMTDTLGKDLPHLRQLLRENYPQYSFALLNYGQGSTDLENGLFRLTNTTKYLDTYYPPLLSFKPDILVVESFAYNHWSGEKYDLDRQWLTYAKIIDTVKAYSLETKIILAASIAPNFEFFGDGKLNWGKELKWESSMTTKAYLQNLVNFATSEKYPLADAYHASMDVNGNGIRLFINGGDNLHPSNEGALLYSQKIMEAIKSNQMIK